MMNARVERPRIAVFAGPTATVLNSAPLITSNAARRRHGLTEMLDSFGDPVRFDQLRPQRLATPVTVYIEQHSAHPLERDAAHLYAPPDGYVDAQGMFHKKPTSDADRPVYEVTLRPEDGLYPLPYMARRADGSAWEADDEVSGNSPELARQTFYPDAARVFEEIDRLGIGEVGESNLLTANAEYDFYRPAPSGGYLNGLPATERTDVGAADIAQERWGEDFFPYRPRSLRAEPPRRVLAEISNVVQDAMKSGAYEGGLWLEGSPTIEETIYWLNLVVDTASPLVGVASPEWPHGTLGAGGDRNLIHATRYILSRIWAADDGADRIGAVLVDAERAIGSRDVQKVDARPGGFIATGGHGGIVASLGDPGPPVLANVPVWRHTWQSMVRCSQMPPAVTGCRRDGGDIRPIEVRTHDAAGRMIGEALPTVTIYKHARWLATGSDPAEEVELLSRIEHNLSSEPLAGIVVEATAPYGNIPASVGSAVRLAALSGMPVVRVGRGTPEGWVPRERIKLGIAGANLTATKARMLLMACLLRFGSLPAAADPTNPTEQEVDAVERALKPFQAVFDTH